MSAGPATTPPETTRSVVRELNCGWCGYESGPLPFAEFTRLVELHATGHHSARPRESEPVAQGRVRGYVIATAATDLAETAATALYNVYETAADAQAELDEWGIGPERAVVIELREVSPR